MKCAAIFSAFAVSVPASGLEEQAAANPIRKVVTMLQNMEKRIRKAEETEQELYDRYMCYCKSGTSDLERSIAASEAKVPEVGSAITEAQAQKEQGESDLKQYRADREAAKTTMADARAIREKEAKSFAAYKSDADANIGAISKALTSLESGMAGSFLQSGAAQQMRGLLQSQADISDVDREDLVSFLSSSATDASSYAPSSGEITGILKQLKDLMVKNLDAASAAEESSIKDYDGLMAAKTKQVAALTVGIEQKTIRGGELSVEIVQLKNDLSSTQMALLEDRKFLADMDNTCAQKKAEWAEIKRTRSEEVVAISETVKLLNDDDALELFKKAIPSSSSSFVQVEARTMAEVRERALAVISAAAAASHGPARHQFDFLVLVLHGKKKGFASVIKMVDDMIALLKKEQNDDIKQKEYCEASFDSADDKKKGLEQAIADAEKAAADAQEGVAKLAGDINTLRDGIEALDKQVVEATEQRKEENEEFTSLMASDTAAVDVLNLAKNRLYKFYSPALHVPAAERELSEEDSIMVSMGGTAPPTPAPGGVAGTGITGLVQVAVHTQLWAKSAAPPKSFSAYKKSEESTGVLAMMDVLIKGLDKEMTEAKTAESDAQADYENMSVDAAEKRAADVTATTEKETAKASMEAALMHHTDVKESTTKELMALLEFVNALHHECDWLLSYFTVRQQARDGEIDSLAKAKAVLSGADYSLVQTQARSLRGRV